MARDSRKLVAVAADRAVLLMQQDEDGFSVGDLVQLGAGVGQVARIDKRTRTLYARRVRASAAGVDKAASAFKDFSGAAPGKVFKVPAKMPREVWMLGELEAVIYRTVRDGRKERYLHKFKARPALAVSSDGQQLVILGGGYRVTERGIEG